MLTVREAGMHRALRALDESQQKRFLEQTGQDISTREGVEKVVDTYQPLADASAEGVHKHGTTEHKYQVACVLQDALCFYDQKDPLLRFLQEICLQLPQTGDDVYVCCAAFAALCYLREDVPNVLLDNISFFDLARGVVAPLWQQLIVFRPSDNSTPLGHFCKVPSAVGGMTGDGCYLVSSWRMLWQLICTGHDARLLSKENILVVLLRLGAKDDGCGHQGEWWFDGVCGCPSAKISADADTFLCPPPSSAINRLLSKLQVIQLYTEDNRDWAYQIADMCSLTHECPEVHVLLQRKMPQDHLTGLTYWAPVAECAEGDVEQLLERTSKTLARQGAKYGHVL